MNYIGKLDSNLEFVHKVGDLAGLAKIDKANYLRLLEKPAMLMSVIGNVLVAANLLFFQEEAILQEAACICLMVHIASNHFCVVGAKRKEGIRNLKK